MVNAATVVRSKPVSSKFMVLLNEFDINEWYDVYRHFKPDTTRAEFEKVWAEFVEFKEQHQRPKPN